MPLQAIDAILWYKEQGLSLNRCTVASDGFGSWPVYDQQGKLLSYEVGLGCSCHAVLGNRAHMAIRIFCHTTPEVTGASACVFLESCVSCSSSVAPCCLQVADLGAIMRFLIAMVHEEGWQLPTVLQFMTSNAATVLQLPHKGQVSPVHKCTLPWLNQNSVKWQSVSAVGAHS